jgi:hypothetical protein
MLFATDTTSEQLIDLASFTKKTIRRSKKEPQQSNEATVTKLIIANS